MSTRVQSKYNKAMKALTELLNWAPIMSSHFDAALLGLRGMQDANRQLFADTLHGTVEYRAYTEGVNK